MKRTASPIVFPSGLRSDQFMVVAGRVRPVVAGGADGDPPTPPPVPPPAPPAPDLDALQAALDNASRNAGSKATTDLLGALGFENLDAAKDFVTQAREKADAEKSELQKAQEAAARAELAATQARAEAAAAQRVARVDRALLAKGVQAAVLDKVRLLVDVPDDADDTAVATAVEALAAEFPAVFTPATPQPGGARSGVTGAKPPAAPQSGKDPMQEGRELFAAKLAARQANQPAHRAS